MADLKSLRKRIGSVKNTQKITRAMKMVAAAKLRRAQQRITELRPFAVKTAEVLRGVSGRIDEGERIHPLLARRDEKEVLLVVVGSDRGLAGGFNANVNRAAERAWHEMEGQAKHVRFATIGRKARDYFRRRGGDILVELPGVNEKLEIGRADEIAAQLIDLYTGHERKPEPIAHEDGRVAEEASATTKTQFDAVYLIYNEYKSAMTQRVAIDRILPVRPDDGETGATQLEYLYEPDRKALLDRLLPIYVQITVYRSLLESVASFFGAQMTAMDAATGNAKDMIASLTLVYNRARQAAITKELMEIIGGAEALK